MPLEHACVAGLQQHFCLESEKYWKLYQHFHASSDLYFPYRYLFFVLHALFIALFDKVRMSFHLKGIRFKNRTDSKEPHSKTRV